MSTEAEHQAGEPAVEVAERMCVHEAVTRLEKEVVPVRIQMI